VDRSAAAWSAIVAFGAPNAGGGLKRQLRRHRDHRDRQTLGQRDDERLEDLFRIDTIDLHKLLDGFRAERLVARVVLVLQHLVGDLRA
jgi:hypothetical protein